MRFTSCAADCRRTMDRIDYNEWKRQRPRFRRILLDLENTFQGRAPGNRPRDPEKEKLLARLDRARFQRYLKSGKIEILGPRRWKWRIDFRTP